MSLFKNIGKSIDQWALTKTKKLLLVDSPAARGVYGKIAPELSFFILLSEPEVPPGVTYYKCIDEEKFTAHRKLSDKYAPSVDREINQRILDLEYGVNSESPILTYQEIRLIAFKKQL